MDKEKFWNMIDEARNEVGIDDMSEKLSEELSKLEISEMAVFHNIYWEYMNLSYKNKLWAAAYVMNGGCSDDGFDYFRGWLIAMGKDTYMKALENPESLVELGVEMEDAEYEDMLGVSYQAYFLKIGGERDYDGFRAETEKNVLSKADKLAIADEIQYAGDIDIDWDEDGLDDLLPKLCKAYEY